MFGSFVAGFSMYGEVYVEYWRSRRGWRAFWIWSWFWCFQNFGDSRIDASMRFRPNWTQEIPNLSEIYHKTIHQSSLTDWLRLPDFISQQQILCSNNCHVRWDPQDLPCRLAIRLWQLKLQHQQSRLPPPCCCHQSLASKDRLERERCACWHDHKNTSSWSAHNFISILQHRWCVQLLKLCWLQ